mmetsp:Transcript_56134/g.131531  ORF Transcript_56134/g.131531 Transcript_56134/m.131531 type:complete len:453 (+) Transcript_56134:1221-2579(+)
MEVRKVVTLHERGGERFEAVEPGDVVEQTRPPVAQAVGVVEGDCKHLVRCDLDLGILDEEPVGVLVGGPVSIGGFGELVERLGEGGDELVELVVEAVERADLAEVVEALDRLPQHLLVLRRLEHHRERRDHPVPRDQKHVPRVHRAHAQRRREPVAVLVVHARQQVVPPRLVRVPAAGVGGRRKVLGHLDLILADVVVDGGQELGGQVLVVVDPAVHPQKVLLRHLLLDLHVVEIRVEHDDRVGQDVDRVGARKRPGHHGKVARGEGLDDARDLLALAGEAERREVPAQRVAELHVGEVEGVGEFREGLEVQVVGLAEVESDGGLVEAGAGAEERADADGLEDLGEQPEALAELEALGRLAVELLRAHGQPLLALLREPQLLDRVRRLLRGQLLLVRLRLVVVQLRGLVAPARVRQRPQDRKQPLQRQQIQRVQRPRQRERVLAEKLAHVFK